MRDLKRTLTKVRKSEEKIKNLSDEELSALTEQFKSRYSDGESLESLMPEAFAAICEADYRVLGKRPYDVQILAAAALHGGYLAEMNTGEGKTLSATMPLYLNALTGKSCMLVTTNEYLASRDGAEMGEVYNFMGLSCSYPDADDTKKQDDDEKRQFYSADIIYTTNGTLGFDFLFDNLVKKKEDRFLCDFHYVIIDEADSVLLDSAIMPLVISGVPRVQSNLYDVCDFFVTTLVEDIDYIEEDKAVWLTPKGVKFAESFFGISNFYGKENFEINRHVTLSLRAHKLLKNKKDYVVTDKKEVELFDGATGRLMHGVKLRGGQHQAIEAKENVKVKRESKTLATITFQNFFNKFDKKAGMTGTALTEEKEFRDIYGMDVIEIPTNKPVQRIDHHDAVYKTKKEKYRAVVEEVKKAHEKGQPVLVGTINIDTSELLSGMLKREGIPHTVLNAKFHELEAEIVAGAGQHGAVTIATNMAGRGTDIKLDDDARAAGGLKIIGTERHESRRIDNQLRGRSGRQGDVGESQFFISLEDDLMRLFGSDKLMDVFNALGVPENEQIQHKMLTSAIEKAQQKIEANNYGIRKNLLEYDQVMNDQREIIYKERLRVLNGESMRDAIFKMITDRVESCVDTCISSEIPKDEWDLNELNQLLLPIIPLEPITEETIADIRNNKELKHLLKEKAVKLYEAKETEFPEPEQFRELERVVLLKVIDQKWMDHIDDMDQLRQGIGLQAYGQRDPLVEYKMAGFDMFDEMTANIQEDTIRLLYHVKIEQKVEREQVAKVTGTNKDDSAPAEPKKRAAAKIYPNDPCPCGSGKKYKQCCGRFAE